MVSKSKRKMWSHCQESMIAAVNTVINAGSSLCTASRLYSVPVKSSRRRVIGRVDVECRQTTCKFPCLHNALDRHLKAILDIYGGVSVLKYTELLWSPKIWRTSCGCLVSWEPILLRPFWRLFFFFGKMFLLHGVQEYVDRYSFWSALPGYGPNPLPMWITGKKYILRWSIWPHWWKDWDDYAFSVTTQCCWISIRLVKDPQWSKIGHQPLLSIIIIIIMMIFNYQKPLSTMKKHLARARQGIILL